MGIISDSPMIEQPFMAEPMIESWDHGTVIEIAPMESAPLEQPFESNIESTALLSRLRMLQQPHLPRLLLPRMCRPNRNPTTCLAIHLPQSTCGSGLRRGSCCSRRPLWFAAGRGRTC